MQILAMGQVSPEKHKWLKLERLLYEWSLWKQTGGLGHFHVRSKSIGECFTHYGETDYQPHLIFMSQMVDAVIKDLKPMERQAIFCEYLRDRDGNEMPWTYDFPLGRILVVAYESIRMGLKKKGFEP
jgi:hypothetical protein